MFDEEIFGTVVHRAEVRRTELWHTAVYVMLDQTGIASVCRDLSGRSLEVRFTCKIVLLACRLPRELNSLTRCICTLCMTQETAQRDHGRIHIACIRTRCNSLLLLARFSTESTYNITISKRIGLEMEVEPTRLVVMPRIASHSKRPSLWAQTQNLGSEELRRMSVSRSIYTGI